MTDINKPAGMPEVTDAMALAFHNALTDGAIGDDEVEEIKTGLRAALSAAPAAPAGWDAEFLAKRLGRVAKLAGLPDGEWNWRYSSGGPEYIGKGNHQFSGKELCDLLNRLLPAAPAAPASAVAKDAERWNMIADHWTKADIRNNKDGSFKSMTITCNASMVCDQANKQKLNSAIDAAMGKEGK